MSEMLKLACVQMTSGCDVAANIAFMQKHARLAAKDGARFIAFPETCNLMAKNAASMREQIAPEKTDETLAAMCALAAEHGVWLSLGSLIVKDDGEEVPVNRSLLIDDKGRVAARYDKIHMFDVELDNGETHKESRVYRAGKQAMVAQVAGRRLGLSICYDLRFGALYEALARAKAEFIIVPAAFTVPTGRAHWEVLLRARAIETGAFIVAAAQHGTHENGRKTYGNSMIVSPWGEVLARARARQKLIFATLDFAQVAKARAQIPSLAHKRDFSAP